MLAAEDSWPGHLSVLGNGSLVIEEFGWRDRGEYSCYVDNMLGNDTQSVQLELEPRYRHVIYMWSLLYGLVTAVSFLGNKITSAANRSIGEVVQSWRRPLLGPSPG